VKNNRRQKCKQKQNILNVYKCTLCLQVLNGLFLDLLPKSKSIHFINQPNNKNIATSRVFFWLW